MIEHIEQTQEWVCFFLHLSKSYKKPYKGYMYIKMSKIKRDILIIKSVILGSYKNQYLRAYAFQIVHFGLIVIFFIL
jgi:hypothetical protein